jgi:hypothetical protein
MAAMFAASAVFRHMKIGAMIENALWTFELSYFGDRVVDRVKRVFTLECTVRI